MFFEIFLSRELGEVLINKKLVFNERASSILYDYFLYNKSKTVYLPANVCPIVLFVAEKAGIKYKIFDIDSKSYCIDLKLVEETELNKNVIVYFVYMYSLGSTGLSSLQALHDQYGVQVVLDKCLCFPNLEDEFNFVDIVLYSTFVSKPTTLNWGGIAIVTSNLMYQFNKQNLTFDPYDEGKLSELMRKKDITRKDIISFSKRNWLLYHHGSYSSEYLLRYRCDIANTTNVVKKQKLIKHRLYQKIIQRDDISFLDAYDWRTCIKFNDGDLRNKVLENIFKSGFFASAHYKSMASAFDDFSAPCAEELQNTILNLFNDINVTLFDVENIGRIINET